MQRKRRLGEMSQSGLKASRTTRQTHHSERCGACSMQQSRRLEGITGRQTPRSCRRASPTPPHACLTHSTLICWTARSSPGCCGLVGSSSQHSSHCLSTTHRCPRWLVSPPPLTAQSIRIGNVVARLVARSRCASGAFQNALQELKVGREVEALAAVGDAKKRVVHEGLLRALLARAKHAQAAIDLLAVRVSQRRLQRGKVQALAQNREEDPAARGAIDAGTRVDCSRVDALVACCLGIPAECRASQAFPILGRKLALSVEALKAFLARSSDVCVLGRVKRVDSRHAGLTASNVVLAGAQRALGVEACEAVLRLLRRVDEVLVHAVVQAAL
mmetsp:Transcript_31306/g.93465  ORF Transcript_31306/g.93465 Transcript_31306/m.93465 type:complete len:331 (-) Transcript_31306:2057-3049(-)